MTGPSRHQAGATVAGEKTGGQFKASERTTTESFPLAPTSGIQRFSGLEAEVEAREILSGDVVDMAPLWTREYEEEVGVVLGAEFTYFEVEETDTLADGSVVVYFLDAPMNAVLDPDQKLKVATDPATYGSGFFPEPEDREEVARAAQTLYGHRGDLKAQQLAQLASRGFCGWTDDLTEELDQLEGSGSDQVREAARTVRDALEREQTDNEAETS